MASGPPAADVEEPISAKELEEVEEALEAVSDERRSMKIEKEELDTLKQDVSEYTEVSQGSGVNTLQQCQLAV